MKASILAELPHDFPWKDRIRYFGIIGSTNSKAKELAAQGAPHGTVLIADAQTGGKGRLGRSFHSPAGAGIYLSVILRPQCPAVKLMHLTCAAAVAMCNAIEETIGFRPGIKWTNDLVWGKKKLGGILSELSLDAAGNVDYTIIGIGVNCCQGESDFPEHIRPIATSLAAVTGRPIDRSQVAAAMIAALSTMADTLHTEKASIMDRYRADCITTGRQISVVNGDDVRHGFADGIDDDGGLLVTFLDGHRETINSGEVSVRGMYGYIN